MKTILLMFAFAAVLYSVTHFIQMLKGIRPDDTDKSFFDRSGMHLFTDHKTGIQYVGSPYGGITTRLDSSGFALVKSQSIKLRDP